MITGDGDWTFGGGGADNGENVHQGRRHRDPARPAAGPHYISPAWRIRSPKRRHREEEKNSREIEKVGGQRAMLFLNPQSVRRRVRKKKGLHEKNALVSSRNVRARFL